MANVIWTGRKNANEALRVSLDTFKGHHLCDLRIVVPLTATAPDALTPTKKGVAFRVTMLPEIIEALNLALAVALDEGMLEGAA